MKLSIALIAALSLTASAGTALAKNDKNKGNGKGKGKSDVVTILPAPAVRPGNCPPGLAKKNPPCIPPGQVGKVTPYYKRGDILDGDYRIIRDPGRYRLNGRGNYAVLGDYVYQIDPDTRKVLNLIGALADLAQ